MGSHLDTQPTGGKYDGVLGVLGALEVVRTMNDLGIQTRHPIVVTNWTNEEGARFAPAMLASGVFAGIHTRGLCQWPHATRRARSSATNWRGSAGSGDETVGARKMHAMLELHIEQGPILEAEGKEIGVVTHGQGLWWLEITLTGQGRAYRLDADEHAGECGPGHGADHRARAPDRDERTSRTPWARWGR